MKKILCTVAAFGLVAGVASTAAAVDFSVSGRYEVDGYYLSDANGNGFVLQDVGDVGSDAYFLQSFKMAPILKINDEIKMVTDIWLADNNVWGSGQDEERFQGGPGVNSNVELWQLYLEWESPVGELRVGRQLGSTVFGTDFLDTISRADGIEWSPSILARGPWKTILKYEKLKEEDGNVNGNFELHPEFDTGIPESADVNQDNDYYEIDLSHNGDRGLGQARVGYFNEQAPVANETGTKEWVLSAAGQYKLPVCYINAEIDYRNGTATRIGEEDLDIKTLAGYLQVGKKIGALDVSGTYIYASGDSDPLDNDLKAAAVTVLGEFGGLGNEFEPYYILTGSQAGIFNTEFATGGPSGEAARFAGLHSFGVQANYAMSEKLMLHGAVAYSMAADEEDGWDSSYGIEFNIGAAYRLLENLTYEVHFGYLDTGDFFQGPNGLFDTQSVYLASNHLTMTF